MTYKATFLAIVLGSGLAAGVPAARAQSGGHGEDAHASMHGAGQGGETTGHSHSMCERHGGQVTMTKAYHFETVFSPDGIRIYSYSGEQSPLMTQKARGMATLRFQSGTTQEIPLVLAKPQGGETTVYFCPMHAEVVQMEPGECSKCGGMRLFAQDYLYAKADLSQIEPGSLKVEIRLEGLSADEPDVLFTETYAAAPAKTHTHGMEEAAPSGGAKEGAHQGHMH